MKEDIYAMVEERVRRLKAWLDGELTAEEAAEFEEWLECHPADRKLLERMEGMEALAARMRFCERNDREVGWKNIQRRIRRSALIRRLGRSVAAVMAFGMLAGGAWYYAGMEKEPVLLVQEKVHIVPGSSQAYLELATGEQFVLDSMRGVDTRVDGAVMKTQEAGQLVVSGDSEDTLVKQVQYHRIVVPKTGEYNMVLADGTQIWLNSCSSLEFPARFIGDERRVRLLSGEAYFEVAKNEGMPFVVEAQGKEVRVLGTSFDVDIYEGEFATTLVTGKVEVSTGEKEYLLSPSMQLRMADGRTELRKVKAEDFAAWKDGVLVFRKQRLEKVLAALARWYDIEVFFQKEELKDLHFTGILERHGGVEELMDFLGRTGSVKFTLNGRLLMVLE